MNNACVIIICNTFLVLGIVLSRSYTFALIMDAHAFNAPPSSSRRIIGYQCTNPNCGKVFTNVFAHQCTNPHCGTVITNVFAYDQHRNHATRAGTLCASIMMREELTGIRRADRATAVLSARPHPGEEHRVTRAKTIMWPALSSAWIQSLL